MATGASATYDAANEQTTVNGLTLTASFTYDALGRRTSKTINGQTTTFVYDGDDIVAEVDSQAGLVTYLRGLTVDEPFVRQTSNGNEYYHTDVLGSTVVLSDDAGTATTTYTYDPFGKTTVTGSSTNAFRYTSRENDETGLYYYRARYYSPTLHRFISEDPIGFTGGEENFFSYVGNNPINGFDPLGLCGIDVNFNPLGPGYYHAHIVTTDPSGAKTGFRGGPSRGGPSGGSSGALSSGSGGASTQKSPGRGGSSNSGNSSNPGSGPGGQGKNNGPWGAIQTTSGDYRPGFIDYPAAGEGPLPSMNILNNSQPCTNYNSQITQHMQAIQNAKIPYNPLTTNSNAVVQNVLTRSGFTPGPPPVWASGWNTTLP